MNSHLYVCPMFEATAETFAGDAPVWVRLCEWGQTNSKNGEFIFDEESGQAIDRQIAEHGVEVPFDYEHQSMRGEWAAPDGRAPASGWLKAVKWEQGKGLYALVQWTERAKEYLARKEYRYLSPVLTIRKKDNKVVGLHSVALTNKPAIPRTQALAASEVPPNEEKTMSGTNGAGGDYGMLVAAMKAQGIQVQDGADAAALTTAFGTYVKARAAADEIACTVRTALSLKADAGKDEIVLAIAKVKQQADANTSTLEELKKFKEQEEDRRAGELVQTFVKCNKLNPNDKPAMEAAMSLAKKDPSTLTALMANTVPYVTPGRTSDPGPGATAGSAKEEELIANAMKEHSNNAGKAYEALQIQLLKPHTEAGLTPKAARERCEKEYPKIFGAA